METLFSQFVVVFRLAETVSKVLFTDQNEELMLFKQAERAFTVQEVFQAVLLMDSANKETFFNQTIVLTREDDTVFEFTKTFESIIDLKKYCLNFLTSCSDY